MKEDLYIKILLWAHDRQETGFSLRELKERFSLNEQQMAWVKNIFVTSGEVDRRFFEILYYDQKKQENFYSLNEKGITAAINYKGLDHAEKIGQRAIIFAGISMALSIFAIIIQIEEMQLTEFSTRGERIYQISQINNSIKFCNENPDAEDSFLKLTSNAESASCDEVLRVYGSSTISVYTLSQRFFSLF